MLKGGYKKWTGKIKSKNNFTITFIRELKFTLEDDMTMSSFSRVSLYLFEYTKFVVNLD